MASKPTAQELGIDVDAQAWRRSGEGDGAIEIAFVSPAAGAAVGAAGSRGPGGAEGAAAGWVLMRVAGDPEGRVLVYDRHEWECFLDGARGGEFDDAAG
jgi:Domain of unknown function (DUF397)